MSGRLRTICCVLCCRSASKDAHISYQEGSFLLSLNEVADSPHA